MVEPVLRTVHGDVFYLARNLVTGAEARRGPGKRVGTASVIKLPILAAAVQAVKDGKASLDEPIKLRGSDKVIGSGVLQKMSDGIELPLRDALLLMIILSDNTATNLIIDRFGIAELNDRFRRLGMLRTTLLKYVFKPPTVATPDTDRFGLGVTRCVEVVDLLARVAQGALLGGRFDEFVLDVLSKQELKNGIPRFLPPEWGFAGKSGSVDTMRNDVGIVTRPDGQRLAIAVFCQNLSQTQWSPDEPAQVMIGRIAQLACACLLD